MELIAIPGAFPMLQGIQDLAQQAGARHDIERVCLIAKQDPEGPGKDQQGHGQHDQGSWQHSLGEALHFMNAFGFFFHIISLKLRKHKSFPGTLHIKRPRKPLWLSPAGRLILSSAYGPALSARPFPSPPKIIRFLLTRAYCGDIILISERRRREG